MPIIRPSQSIDIAQITAIYQHHVLHGTGTFEVEPPTETDMTQRRADVLGKGLPYLVAADGDRLLGFAYRNWFKPRTRQRCVASVPQREPDQAERAGVRKLIAVIGDSNNLGSIGVHRSAGFQQVGTLASCGWKFERWLDVVLMDKALGLGDATSPA